MLQTPHHYRWCQAPSRLQALTGTGLPDGVPINAIRVSPAMTGRGAVGRLREDACAR